MKTKPCTQVKIRSPVESARTIRESMKIIYQLKK